MTTIHHMRKLIDHHRARLNEWGICEIGLFGSYVRGEEHSHSDVDILIDIERPTKMDLLDLIALEQELSEELATTVDLVLKSNLKPAIRQTILSEVEYFF
ncbi:MAG: nucleotidyltransferase family protein [Salinispira sp.]